MATIEINRTADRRQFVLHINGADALVLNEQVDLTAALLTAEWLSDTDEQSVTMVLGEYHRHGPGVKPGHFFGHLLKALGHADGENLERVAQGFPELVAAVKVWKFVHGSPEILEAYLNGRWFE